MWPLPRGIGEDVANSPFVLPIVCTIGLHGIACAFVFVGHSLRRLPPPFREELARRMLEEPIDVLLTTMGLVFAEAVLEFFTEGHTQPTEPSVVIQTLTGPNCTGVLRILNRQVAALLGVR